MDELQQELEICALRGRIRDCSVILLQILDTGGNEPPWRFALLRCCPTC